MENAVVEYQSRKFSSLREVAWITGVDRRTIPVCLKGRTTRRKAQEMNQNLSRVEEEEVTRAI